MIANEMKQIAVHYNDSVVLMNLVIKQANEMAKLGKYSHDFYFTKSFNCKVLRDLLAEAGYSTDVCFDDSGYTLCVSWTTGQSQTKEIAVLASDLKQAVDESLTYIKQQASVGKLAAAVMHDRKFTMDKTTSLVADELRKLGFVVDSTDEFDCKANNYRRIRVEW